MEGRTLGDFVLRERLGGGGGGEVYRAEQIALSRDAVVKVMLHGGGREASERFLREARLASQLDHPFAAHVYGFGTEPDGLLWIAMELVRGTALNTVIKERGPIPLARFVPFFERLCEVVHAAHEQGIVHRDIKPANVMVLQRAGRLLPKLLDLGIARRGAEAGVLTKLPDDADLDESTQDGPGDTESTSGSVTVSRRLVDAETLNITRVGVIVGTPHFMAPEQWADASSADARADLYSLTILAFQALTARMPFSGKSIHTLARAHASAALPPLPDFLPVELQAVLAKGAAKQPSNRFATALELGAALRAASGIGVEPLALPQLDEALRENFLSEAPQPLAESLTLLERARTARQQVEAVVAVRRVVVRLLAVLALASRGRVGPGAARDADDVASLLRKLGAEGLSDAEWLQLAQELCRPFAAQAAAHPVPELVTFFFAGLGAAAGPGALALATLDQLGLPNPETSDDTLHARLLKLVPAVETVLRSLSFLFDYSLVVQREEPERWMGARLGQRRVQPVAAGSTPLPVGVPVLIDAVGLVTLTLWPLVQVFTPGAGLPEELFFVDGAGRHGARLGALPGSFERQSDDVWPWFAKHLFDLTQPHNGVAKADRAPYKGLSTFTSEDADNYFGREQEAETFANRLRQSPLLAVVGPSGSGKSSFILAGVLPLLPKGWRAVVTRPGATPFQALAFQLGLSPQELTPEKLSSLLRPGESLLLVIDQFEELVTLCSEVETREAFAQLLVALAEKTGGRVRVVLTCRDDFLIKIQQLRALKERLSSALQLLGTPAKDELLRVVTEPAARAGYGFDDEALPAKMVDEVAEYPGALALLSFTASQLWELRDRHLHQMRAKTYEALGGVGGALAHHAETTLAQMAPGEAKLVREAFRHLVTSHATRAVLTRKEMLDILGQSPEAISVLEKLVVSRLLVTSEAVNGDDRVEIIHEALIVSWPRLVGWLREDAETARLRDALRASAKQWAERGKPSGLLWRKETLVEYRVWRARFPGRLTQLEEAFATASVRDDARARVLRRALVSSAIVILSVGLIVVFRAYQVAEVASHRAEASALDARQAVLNMQEEQGRLALVNDQPLQALATLRAAVAGGGVANGLVHMLSFAQWRMQGELQRLQGHKGRIYNSRLSSDGRSLLTVGTDAKVIVWDVETGRQNRVVAIQCRDGVFTKDDASIVLVCQDGRSLVVDIATGAQRLLTTLENGSAWRLGFSADGTRLALSQFASKVRVLRYPSGETLFEPGSEGGQNLMAVWSDDGERLAVLAGSTLPADGNLHGLRVLNGRTGATLGQLHLDTEARVATFSPDGSWLAFGTPDGSVGVWSVAAKKLAWMSAPTGKAIHRIAVSADGTRLAAAGAGGSLRVWGPSSATVLRTIEMSNAGLRCARFRGEQLFVGDEDGRLFRINVNTGGLEWGYFGHVDMIEGCHFTPDAARIFTTGADGAAIGWDTQISGGNPVAELPQALAIISGAGCREQLIATREGWFVRSPSGGRAAVPAPAATRTLNAVGAISANCALVAVRTGSEVSVLERHGQSFEHVETLTLPAAEKTRPVGLAISNEGFVYADLENLKGALWSRGVVDAPRLLSAPGVIPGNGLFEPTSGRLLMGGDDGIIRRWDPKIGKVEEALKDAARYRVLRPSADPERYFSIGDNVLSVWRFGASVPEFEIPVPLGAAAAVEVEGGIAAVVYSLGVRSTFDLATGKELTRLRLPGPVEAEGSSGAFLVFSDGHLEKWSMALPAADATRAACLTPYTLTNGVLKLAWPLKACLPSKEPGR